MIWIRRLLHFRKTLLFAVVAVAFYNVACHTPKFPLPSGVQRTSLRVPLSAEEVSVSVYVPKKVEGALPVAIVAHGFTRSRRYMAGWGAALAENGMIAVVIHQPAFADWAHNGRAIAELAGLLRAEGDALTGLKTTGDIALVGFSMGGLATLLAAEADPEIRCWVGLDPVDFKGRGVRAISSLDMPQCILRAEPAAWNRSGNARKLIEGSEGPLFTIKVRDATHCDVEEPTDLAGKLACGWTDPARHGVFETYAVVFLRSVLFGDAEAAKVLDEAEADDRVSEVVRR